MKRRNDLDVCADILRTVKEKGGAKKTHLVYGANLNFKMVNRYMKRLLIAGLVMHEAGHGSRDRGLYILTEAGEEFLGKYMDATEMLGPMEVSA